MVDWLKQHWFIFTALATGGVAWGQTVTKVAELETKLNKAEVVIANQSRIDERTIIMQQDMKEQRQILLELLATQRAIARKSNVSLDPVPAPAPRATQTRPATNVQSNK